MVPAFLSSLYLTLYKTDISLRRTACDGPKSVRLRELTVCDKSALFFILNHPRHDTPNDKKGSEEGLRAFFFSNYKKKLLNFKNEHKRNCEIVERYLELMEWISGALDDLTLPVSRILRILSDYTPSSSNGHLFTTATSLQRPFFLADNPYIQSRFNLSTTATSPQWPLSSVPMQGSRCRQVQIEIIFRRRESYCFEVF